MDRKKAIIMGDTVNIRLTAEDKIHLQQRMDETGKKATEVFKSAIYFTEIDADLVDEIIPGLRFYRLPRRSKERPADRARETGTECARYRP